MKAGSKNRGDLIHSQRVIFALPARFKELEKENARLKKLVADQALDNAMLKDIASGKF